MSIARTAPAKWDLQDYCSMLAVLQTGLSDNWQCIVEPQGGEDCELIPPNGSKLSKVEIQVKGIGGSIGADVLSDCLLHFPERRSDNPLIARLEEDGHRRCVLFFSGRVSDVLSDFLVTTDWLDETLKRGQIAKSDCQSILTSLRDRAEALPQGSKLKNSRRAAALNYVSELTESRLKALLGRVCILENQTNDRVKDDCFDLFATRFQVPVGKHRQVLDSIHGVIKAARPSGADILEGVKEIVLRASSGKVAPNDALSRSQEKRWRTQLDEQRALLLTGTPRVGKSYAAQTVAQSYTTLGFEIRLFSSVDQAARYLEDPTLDRRLAILDDPLGTGNDLVSAASELNKLERLIGALRAERLLIVAQISMPLLQISKMTSVLDLKTAGLKWVEIGLPSTEFAQRLWIQCCDIHKVKPKLKAIVLTSIGNGSLILEPGCLDYLAAESERFIGDLTISRIVQFASRSAAQLALTLDEEFQAPLVATLVLASNTSTPAKPRELAFTLHDGEVELPSLQKGISYTSYTVGGEVGDAETEPPPLYTKDFKLSEEQWRALDALERKHWISTDADEGINFRHPTFRGAGSFLLDGATNYARQILEKYLRRALFCMPPATTRVAARNLDWLFSQVENDDAKQIILNSAIDGLNSKYPATSDLCFEFLTKHTEELSDHTDLMKYGRRIAGEDIEDYSWFGGEPYRTLVHRHDPEDVFRRFGGVAEEAVSGTIDQLEDLEKLLPTVESIAKALSYFTSNPGKMNKQHILRLLSFDEGAVRAPAAAAWLRIPRDDDKEVQRRIFQETHPKVAREVLSTLLRVWEDLPTRRQAEMLSGLSDLAQHPSSALVMLSDLEVFDRGSTPSEELAWQIFEELAPLLVSNIPSGISLNDPRLFTIARTAKKYCDADAFARLLSAMLQRVEADLAKDRLPNDHALGVIELTLNGLPATNKHKAELVSRVLSLPGTGARLVVAAEIADAWEILSDEEREKSLEFFTESDGDKNWLFAAVLTRSTPPTELAQAILGRDVADAMVSATSASMRILLRPELLDACLMLYMGTPQPLWWLGKHHGNSQIWQPIVEWVARQPNHDLFDSAFRELADYSSCELLAQIIRDLGAQHSQQLFDLLLDIKRERVGDFFPTVWKALFEICPDNASMDHWISSLAESATSSLEDLSDLANWLPAEQQQLVTEKLVGDVTIVNIGKVIIALAQFDGLERVPEIFDLIDKCITKSPPKVPGTLSFLQRILKHVDGVPENLSGELEKLRLALIKECRPDISRHEGKLVGWLGPA